MLREQNRARVNAAIKSRELAEAYTKLGLPVTFEVVPGGVHGGKREAGESLDAWPDAAVSRAYYAAYLAVVALLYGLFGEGLDTTQILVWMGLGALLIFLGSSIAGFCTVSSIGPSLPSATASST